MARVELHSYAGYTTNPDGLPLGTAMLNFATATGLGLPNSSAVLTLVNSAALGYQIFIPTPNVDNPDGSIWGRVKTGGTWGAINRIA